MIADFSRRRGLGRIGLRPVGRLGDHLVDDAQALLVDRAHRIARAAVAASSVVRHRMLAQPSGEITE